MNYSAAVLQAMTYWGENWWKTCSIRQQAPVNSTTPSYYIAWVTPKLGATRPH